MSQIVDWCFGTVANPITEGAKAALRETDRRRMIVALTNLLRTSQRKLTLLQAAESLGQIDPSNSHAIAPLTDLLHTNQESYYWNIRLQAAKSLRQIDHSNPDAISALIHLLRKHFHLEAADSLKPTDPGNSEAIAALIHLLRIDGNKSFRLRTAESLGKIGIGEASTRR